MAGEKKSRYRVLVTTVFITIVFVFVELIMTSKTVHFSVERIAGFYAFLGVVAAILIIVLGSLMKNIGLKKGEDYYD